MELSESTVNDLLRQAEQRLSQNSSAQVARVSPDQDDSLLNRQQSAVGDGNKLPATAALEPRVVSTKATKKPQTDDAGLSWFGLPRTKLTPELKRDFQVLRLRGALDPKVHYKKSAAKSPFPRFSHVGQIVEGPTEFNSARLTKRERKGTFADEILSTHGLKERSKAKFSGIQKQKSSGKKAYYKSRRRKSYT